MVKIGLNAKRGQHEQSQGMADDHNFRGYFSNQRECTSRNGQVAKLPRDRRRIERAARLL